MKLKLFDEELEEERTFDIGGWDCMKIGFMSSLGWSLLWVVIYILIFVVGIVLS